MITSKPKKITAMLTVFCFAFLQIAPGGFANGPVVPVDGDSVPTLEKPVDKEAPADQPPSSLPDAYMDNMITSPLSVKDEEIPPAPPEEVPEEEPSGNAVETPVTAPEEQQPAPVPEGSDGALQDSGMTKIVNVSEGYGRLREEMEKATYGTTIRVTGTGTIVSDGSALTIPQGVQLVIDGDVTFENVMTVSSDYGSFANSGESLNAYSGGIFSSQTNGSISGTLSYGSVMTLQMETTGTIEATGVEVQIIPPEVVASLAENALQNLNWPEIFTAGGSISRLAGTVQSANVVNSSIAPQPYGSWEVVYALSFVDGSGSSEYAQGTAVFRIRAGESGDYVVSGPVNVSYTVTGVPMGQEKDIEKEGQITITPNPAGGYLYDIAVEHHEGYGTGETPEAENVFEVKDPGAVRGTDGVVTVSFNVSGEGSASLIVTLLDNNQSQVPGQEKFVSCSGDCSVDFSGLADGQYTAVISAQASYPPTILSNDNLTYQFDVNSASGSIERFPSGDPAQTDPGGESMPGPVDWPVDSIDDQMPGPDDWPVDPGLPAEIDSFRTDLEQQGFQVSVIATGDTFTVSITDLNNRPARINSLSFGLEYKEGFYRVVAGSVSGSIGSAYQVNDLLFQGVLGHRCPANAEACTAHYYPDLDAIRDMVMGAIVLGTGYDSNKNPSFINFELNGNRYSVKFENGSYIVEALSRISVAEGLVSGAVFGVKVSYSTVEPGPEVCDEYGCHPAGHITSYYDGDHNLIGTREATEGSIEWKNAEGQLIGSQVLTALPVDQDAFDVFGDGLAAKVEKTGIGQTVYLNGQDHLLGTKTENNGVITWRNKNGEVIKTDITPEKRAIAAVKADLEKMFGLKGAEFDELIESMTFDGTSVSVKFKTGNMGAGRLLDVLGKGVLPTTAVFSMGKDQKILSSVLTWGERKGSYAILEARISYPQDALMDISWAKESGYACLSGEICYAIVRPPEITQLYREKYTQDTPDTVSISRLPYFSSQPILLPGSVLSPDLLKLINITTLRRMEDGRYHVKTVKSYENGEVTAVSEFRYLASNPACRADGFCPDPKVSLDSIVRKDAKGNPLSVISGIHSVSIVPTDRPLYEATITVDGNDFDVTFESLEELLNKAVQIEMAVYPVQPMETFEQAGLRAIQNYLSRLVLRQDFVQFQGWTQHADDIFTIFFSYDDGATKKGDLRLTLSRMYLGNEMTGVFNRDAVTQDRSAGWMIHDADSETVDFLNGLQTPPKFWRVEDGFDGEAMEFEYIGGKISRMVSRSGRIVLEYGDFNGLWQLLRGKVDDYQIEYEINSGNNIKAIVIKHSEKGEARIEIADMTAGAFYQDATVYINGEKTDVLRAAYLYAGANGAGYRGYYLERNDETHLDDRKKLMMPLLEAEIEHIMDRIFSSAVRDFLTSLDNAVNPVVGRVKQIRFTIFDHPQADGTCQVWMDSVQPENGKLSRIGFKLSAEGTFDPESVTAFYMTGSGEWTVDPEWLAANQPVCDEGDWSCGMYVAVACPEGNESCGRWEYAYVENCTVDGECIVDIVPVWVSEQDIEFWETHQWWIDQNQPVCPEGDMSCGSFTGNQKMPVDGAMLFQGVLGHHCPSGSQECADIYYPPEQAVADMTRLTVSAVDSDGAVHFVLDGKSYKVYRDANNNVIVERDLPPGHVMVEQAVKLQLTNLLGIPQPALERYLAAGKIRIFYEWIEAGGAGNVRVEFDKDIRLDMTTNLANLLGSAEVPDWLEFDMQYLYPECEPNGDCSGVPVEGIIAGGRFVMGSTRFDMSYDGQGRLAKVEVYQHGYCAGPECPDVISFKSQEIIYAYGEERWEFFIEYIWVEDDVIEEPIWVPCVDGNDDPSCGYWDFVSMPNGHWEPIELMRLVKDDDTATIRYFRWFEEQNTMVTDVTLVTLGGEPRRILKVEENNPVAGFKTVVFNYAPINCFAEPCPTHGDLYSLSITYGDGTKASVRFNAASPTTATILVGSESKEIKFHDFRDLLDQVDSLKGVLTLIGKMKKEPGFAGYRIEASLIPGSEPLRYRITVTLPNGDPIVITEWIPLGEPVTEYVPVLVGFQALCCDENGNAYEEPVYEIQPVATCPEGVLSADGAQCGVWHEVMIPGPEVRTGGLEGMKFEVLAQGAIVLETLAASYKDVAVDAQLLFGALHQYPYLDGKFPSRPTDPNQPHILALSQMAQLTVTEVKDGRIHFRLGDERLVAYREGTQVLLKRDAPLGHEVVEQTVKLGLSNLLGIPQPALETYLSGGKIRIFYERYEAGEARSNVRVEFDADILLDMTMNLANLLGSAEVPDWLVFDVEHLYPDCGPENADCVGVPEQVHITGGRFVMGSTRFDMSYDEQGRLAKVEVYGYCAGPDCPDEDSSPEVEPFKSQEIMFTYDGPGHSELTCEGVGGTLNGNECVENVWVEDGSSGGNMVWIETECPDPSMDPSQCGYWDSVSGTSFGHYESMVLGPAIEQWVPGGNAAEIRYYEHTDEGNMLAGITAVTLDGDPRRIVRVVEKREETGEKTVVFEYATIACEVAPCPTHGDLNALNIIYTDGTKATAHFDAFPATTATVSIGDKSVEVKFQGFRDLIDQVDQMKKHETDIPFAKEIAAHLGIPEESIVTVKLEDRKFVTCMGPGCPTWSKYADVIALVDGQEKHFAGFLVGGSWGDTATLILKDSRQKIPVLNNIKTIFLLETSPRINGRTLEAIADKANLAANQLIKVELEEGPVCKGPGCPVWAGKLHVEGKQGNNPVRYFEGSIKADRTGDIQIDLKELPLVYVPSPAMTLPAVVEQYAQDGTHLRTVTLDADGKVTQITTHAAGREGEMPGKAVIFKQGSAQKFSEVFYKTDGTVEKVAYYQVTSLPNIPALLAPSDALTFPSTLKHYDAQGNLIREFEMDASGQPVSMTAYGMTPISQLPSKVEVYKDGKLFSTISYNENGEVIKVEYPVPAAVQAFKAAIDNALNPVVNGVKQVRFTVLDPEPSGNGWQVVIVNPSYNWQQGNLFSKIVVVFGSDGNFEKIGELRFFSYGETDYSVADGQLLYEAMASYGAASPEERVVAMTFCHSVHLDYGGKKLLEYYKDGKNYLAFWNEGEPRTAVVEQYVVLNTMLECAMGAIFGTSAIFQIEREVGGIKTVSYYDNYWNLVGTREMGIWKNADGSSIQFSPQSSFGSTPGEIFGQAPVYEMVNDFSCWGSSCENLAWASSAYYFGSYYFFDENYNLIGSLQGARGWAWWDSARRLIGEFKQIDYSYSTNWELKTLFGSPAPAWKVEISAEKTVFVDADKQWVGTKTIVKSAAQTPITLWRDKDGKVVKVQVASEDVWGNPEISADGRYVMFATRVAGGGSKVYVYDLTGKGPAHEFLLGAGMLVSDVPPGPYSISGTELTVKMMKADTKEPAGLYVIDLASWQGTYIPEVVVPFYNALKQKGFKVTVGKLSLEEGGNGPAVYAVHAEDNKVYTQAPTSGLKFMDFWVSEAGDITSVFPAAYYGPEGDIKTDGWLLYKGMDQLYYCSDEEYCVIESKVKLQMLTELTVTRAEAGAVFFEKGGINYKAVWNDDHTAAIVTEARELSFAAEIAAHLGIPEESIVTVKLEDRKFVTCMGPGCATWSKYADVTALVDGQEKHFAGFLVGGSWGDKTDKGESLTDLRTIFLLETSPKISGRTLGAIAEKVNLAADQLTKVQLEEMPVCQGLECPVWAGKLHVEGKQGNNPVRYFEGSIKSDGKVDIQIDLNEVVIPFSVTADFSIGPISFAPITFSVGDDGSVSGVSGSLGEVRGTFDPKTGIITASSIKDGKASSFTIKLTEVGNGSYAVDTYSFFTVRYLMATLKQTLEASFSGSGIPLSQTVRGYDIVDGADVLHDTTVYAYRTDGHCSGYVRTNHKWGNVTTAEYFYNDQGQQTHGTSKNVLGTGARDWEDIFYVTREGNQSIEFRLSRRGDWSLERLQVIGTENGKVIVNKVLTPDPVLSGMMLACEVDACWVATRFDFSKNHIILDVTKDGQTRQFAFDLTTGKPVTLSVPVTSLLTTDQIAGLERETGASGRHMQCVLSDIQMYDGYARYDVVLDTDPATKIGMLMIVVAPPVHPGEAFAFQKTDGKVLRFDVSGNLIHEIPQAVTDFAKQVESVMIGFQATPSLDKDIDPARYRIEVTDTADCAAGADCVKPAGAFAGMVFTINGAGDLGLQVESVHYGVEGVDGQLLYDVMDKLIRNRNPGIFSGEQDSTDHTSKPLAYLGEMSRLEVLGVENGVISFTADGNGELVYKAYRDADGNPKLDLPKNDQLTLVQVQEEAGRVVSAAEALIDRIRQMERDYVPVNWEQEPFAQDKNAIYNEIENLINSSGIQDDRLMAILQQAAAINGASHDTYPPFQELIGRVEGVRDSAQAIIDTNWIVGGSFVAPSQEELQALLDQVAALSGQLDALGAEADGLENYDQVWMNAYQSDLNSLQSLKAEAEAIISNWGNGAPSGAGDSGASQQYDPLYDPANNIHEDPFNLPGTSPENPVDDGQDGTFNPPAGDADGTNSGVLDSEPLPQGDTVIPHFEVTPAEFIPPGEPLPEGPVEFPDPEPMTYEDQSELNELSEEISGEIESLEDYLSETMDTLEEVESEGDKDLMDYLEERAKETLDKIEEYQGLQEQVNEVLDNAETVPEEPDPIHSIA